MKYFSPKPVSRRFSYIEEDPGMEKLKAELGRIEARGFIKYLDKWRSSTEDGKTWYKVPKEGYIQNMRLAVQYLFALDRLVKRGNDSCPIALALR